MSLTLLVSARLSLGEHKRYAYPSVMQNKRSNFMNKLVIGFVLLIMLSSCGGGGTNQQLQQYSVEVSMTDPNISFQPQSQHLIMECFGGGCQDKLFVFLPGSDGTPQNHQLILKAMGDLGVSGVALAYQNAGAIQSICLDDDGCYRRSRLDRLFGSDASIYVSSQADGVENRLLMLLQYLGWDAFYTGNSLNYEKIVVGGFSQGAGMAALMGKQKNVQRVCVFAGPWDHTTGPISASWLSDASATPSSDFYGFTHWHDSLTNGVTYLDINWQAMGMGNDAVLSYYNLVGQKFYTSDSDANCVADYHACAVSDNYTPLDGDGKPRYQEVWQYLCGGK